MQHKYELAEGICRRALATRERTIGPDDAVVISSRGTLAEIFRRQGRYAEAEASFRQVLTAQERRLGPEHPELAPSLEYYARILKEMKRNPEAKALFARAHEIEKRNSGAKAFRHTVDTLELGLERKINTEANRR